VTEPQRYHVDPYNLESDPDGAFVTYADAKAWVEREVAAARREGVLEGRRSEWVHQEDEMRDAYEQGQRDERARAVDAAMSHACVDDDCGCCLVIAKAIDGTAPQDEAKLLLALDRHPAGAEVGNAPAADPWRLRCWP